MDIPVESLIVLLFKLALAGIPVGVAFGFLWWLLSRLYFRLA